MIIMGRHTGMLLPYSLCSVKITVIVIIFRSSKTFLCVEAYVLARARVCACALRACACACVYVRMGVVAHLVSMQGVAA